MGTEINFVVVVVVVVNTLDKIYTNLKRFYSPPVKMSPFGLSDHASIEVKPLERTNLPKPKITVKSRDIRPSKRLAMRLYLKEVDSSTLINSQRSCEDKVKLLELIINTGMDRLLPLKSKTHCNKRATLDQSVSQMFDLQAPESFRPGRRSSISHTEKSSKSRAKNMPC